MPFPAVDVARACSATAIAITDGKGNTSVELAVEHEHETVVELLLQPTIGIDINARYKQDRTVLIQASASGLTSVVAKVIAV